MEQPLDFSKSTASKQQQFNVKKPSIQRVFNSASKALNFTSKDYHVNNSENSDENTSRSSASSPDSIENEQRSLNTGHGTLSQQALLMLAAVSNPNLASMSFNAQQLIQGTNGDLNSTLINQLNTFKQQQQHSSNVTPFQLTTQQLNSSPAQAAAFAVSNIMNQQPFNTFAHQLNQSNQNNKQSKSNSNQMKVSGQSKSSSKALSRKSMIMAKQQLEEKQQQPSLNQSAATKFGILSNSQNSNILDSSQSHSPLLNNSLQVSINSNLSGEENSSLYSEMFSPDDGSPRSQRRRGNPIPESLKDDSYWVRRRKNNEAAKKSRDAKRAKDLVTAKRAAILENENSQLKLQVNQIRSENLILRSFLDDDVLYDTNQRRQVDQLLSIGRKVDPERVLRFAQEFHKLFGQHYQIEQMES